MVAQKKMPLPEEESIELGPMEPGETRYSAEPRQTTMREHGQCTIVGANPFSFVPRDMKLRARIGREVDGNAFLKGKPGRSKIHKIAIVLRSFDGKQYAIKDMAQAVEAISGCTRGDMIYMSHCRRAEEDSGLVDVAAGFDCPKCKQRISKAAVDLLDVKATVYDAPATATVRLRDGWEYMSKRVDMIEMAPSRLGVFFDGASAEQLGNEDLMAMAIVAAGITAVGPVDGSMLRLQPGVVQAADIERVSKTLGRAMSERDFVQLHEVVNRIEGDVGMFVPWEHDGCGGTVPRYLGDWGSTFF